MILVAQSADVIKYAIRLFSVLCCNLQHFRPKEAQSWNTCCRQASFCIVKNDVLCNCMRFGSSFWCDFFSFPRILRGKVLTLAHWCTYAIFQKFLKILWFIKGAPGTPRDHSGRPGVVQNAPGTPQGAPMEWSVLLFAVLCVFSHDFCMFSFRDFCSQLFMFC